jgi:hypothetical protein
MQKCLLSIILIFFLSPSISFAIKRTWVATIGGVWSNANNWLPVGVPDAADTAVFNSAIPCELDINTTIAALWAIGFGGNIITTTGLKTLTIDNSANALPVLYVAAGASLSIGNGGGIAFSTYGGSGPNNAQVAGSLVLKSASAWAVNNIGATQITETDISGTINVDPSHTVTVLENSTIATVRFLVSSTLFWRRDGGTIPAADYQDGSTINVTGITATMVAFSTSTNYNGLVKWNATAQDAALTGAAAQLLPTSTYPMDSIRVEHTGLGTLLLTTDPAGFNLGHIEVRGGTLEISAPAPTPSPSTKTGTIATDLKISGGNVFLNATFSGDMPGAAGSMRLTVTRDIIISGGLLNLTNRPTPGTFGAGQIDVSGHVIQTGGTITASSLFGAQNYINMNGGAVQNLQMDNITGLVNLVIINNAGGVNLLNNLLLPRALNLTGGFMVLNNFDVSAPASFLTSSGNGKLVTNGTGSVTVRLMPANSSKVFPIAISSSTYNPVTLVSMVTAVGNDYTMRVEPGNNPAGIYNNTRTIDRTWYISAANNIVSGSVTLGFQYTAAEANASCNPTADMELGHFIPLSNTWNLDPGGSVTPAGANPYTVGTFAPASLVGSFVVGNIGSILAVQTFIDIVAKKRNNSADISWLISTDKRDIKQVQIERAANGNNFIAMATMQANTNLYTDDKLLPGHNYYRVKMTDINGKITYSALAVVLNKENGFDIIGLAPTLVNNNAILNVTAAQKTTMDMVITDITGRQVQKNTYNLIAGSNQVNLNFINLTAGTYQITGYTVDGVSKTLRFVKQ